MDLNKQMKLTDTEDRLGQQGLKWVKGVKRYKLPVISHGDVVCSMVTIVNNTIEFFFDHATWHVGSQFPSRDQTCAPYSGSTESQLLDCQEVLY